MKTIHLNKKVPVALIMTAAIAATLGLGGCAANEAAGNSPTTDAATTGGTSLSGTLNAGGATSQTAAQEAWRAGFQNANPNVTVNYDATGSGTGKQNFSQGGYLVAGTDVPYTAAEASGAFASCATGSTLVEVPVYISPIAVAFHLTGIDALNLDSSTIADIFTGQIQTWDDPAIAALNPGVTLPSTTITPVHRSDSSGTTENFTDYLAQTAPSAWPYPAAQSWPSDLAGEAAQGTQGVRETLSATTGAIGYLDASQASDLGQASIKVGSSWVAYSAQAAAAAVEASSMDAGRASTDLVIDLDRTLTDPTTYPLVLVSYMVACSQYADPNDGALANAYLSHIVSSSAQQAAAQNAGSAPLSQTLAARDASVVGAIK
ncbi:MAG: phosphate ABC transporter substrate-binding protein PstS [Propionibacteriaceae bacterium]|nr:phosphate ABC transporter substrate-binding protein PstS [Propionibacteriaceae bacterium]